MHPHKDKQTTEVVGAVEPRHVRIIDEVRIRADANVA